MMYLICNVTEGLKKSMLFMVSGHLVTFGGHRYSSSRYIMFLVCHLMKQEPMKLSYHPSSFGGHGHSGGSRDIMVSVYHVTFQDQVITGKYDFIVRSSSK